MAFKQGLLGAAALIVVVGGLLLAQGPTASSWQQHRFQKMKVFVETYLDLTDDQKASVEKILAAARTARQPAVTQIKQNRQLIIAAVKAGDTATIDKLSIAQGAQAGQLVAIRAKAAVEMYQLLTPDQKVKADKLQAQLQDMFLTPHGPQM